MSFAVTAAVCVWAIKRKKPITSLYVTRVMLRNNSYVTKIIYLNNLFHHSGHRNHHLHRRQISLVDTIHCHIETTKKTKTCALTDACLHLGLTLFYQCSHKSMVTSCAVSRWVFGRPYICHNDTTSSHLTNSTFVDQKNYVNINRTSA